MTVPPFPRLRQKPRELGARLLHLGAVTPPRASTTQNARAAACEDTRPGSRNGYREVTVKTTAGPVALARPTLRGTAETFASQLFGSHVTKTNALA